MQQPRLANLRADYLFSAIYPGWHVALKNCQEVLPTAPYTGYDHSEPGFTQFCKFRAGVEGQSHSQIPSSIDKALGIQSELFVHTF